MADDFNDLVDSIQPPPGDRAAAYKQAQKFLTPEQAKALIGTNPELREKNIEHRRAMADALRKQPIQAHSAVGALAGIMRGQKQNELEDKAEVDHQNLLADDAYQHQLEAWIKSQMHGPQGGLGDQSPQMGVQLQGPSLEQKLMAQALAKTPNSVGTFLPLTDKETEEAEGVGGGGY